MLTSASGAPLASGVPLPFR
ncbi:hypothetical protein A2U01_0102395, partial [Trifolium medium]|nr:hypothetical protein [Trifolium medium]